MLIFQKDKKYIVVLMLVFLFLPLTTNGSTINKLSRTFNNTGLVGYWTFDGGDINWSTGKVFDRSGQGNDGNLTNLGTTTAIVSGKIGQAMFFGNQTPKYINAGSASSLDDITRKTICAWIKPFSFGSSADDASIVGKWGGFGWVFQLADDAGFQSLYYLHDTNGGPGNWYTPISSITLNVWQHVCVTHDSSSTANAPLMYINGVSQTVTVAFTPTGTFNTDVSFDMYIGNIAGNTQSSFDGYIDDVRVYNRILSATEIKQLYNAGKTTLNKSNTTLVSSGLIGYWTFDGMDTNWATGLTQDKTSNANNGILNNMSTTTSPVFGRIGQGLDFTTAEWVYVGNPSVFSNLNSLSISVWIKPRSFSGGADKIVSKIGGVNPGWALSIEDQSNVEFQVNYNTTDLFVVFNSSNAFSNTKWTNVILTWDGTSQASGAKLYADGVEITNRLTNQNGSASRSDDANTPIVIGARSDTGGPRFSGQIDDVRIYNRVLSATEAGQITNAGKAKVNKSNTNFLSSGLVGYWTFDGPDLNWGTGIVTDRSGQGNNGSINNMSTTTSPKPGRIGQALGFDGVNDHVNISPRPNLPSTATFCAWVYIRSVPNLSEGSIFNDDVGGFSHNYQYGFEVENDGSVGLFWQNNDGIDRSILSNTGITRNNWTHVCIVRSSSTAGEVYFNGVSQAVTVNSGTIPSTSDSIAARIGEKISGLALFDGQIDDVRVYNRALSATEIKQLYNMVR